MSGAIWVLAEAWKGKITAVTYEALALGRELATQAAAPLVAVLPGHGVGALAGSLGAADQVIVLDHPSLSDPVPGSLANALSPLVKERAPKALLIPFTNLTLGAGSLMATRLGVPSVNLCRDVRLEGGRLLAQCVLYGGKIEAQVALDAPTVVLGIWPGARPADAGRVEREVPVESITPDMAQEPRVRLLRYIEPEAGDVDIREQQFLVAVGRGMQDAANMAPAEELAEVLGGAVCGSRPVIDQGWLPITRQVGKSGHTVKPRLYIALGISGAPEHVEGMRDSATIVAVNTDEQAPIFRTAHFGIVEDAVEFLPVLTKALQARVAKGMATHA